VPLYQFLIGPAGGSPAVELAQARNKSISLKKYEPSTASFSIDGRDPQATSIFELATELTVLRDRQPIFRGFVGATTDTISADRHQLQVTAVDYRGRLQRLIIDNDITYTSELDQDIAWTLIDVAQGKTGADLGITRGPVDGVSTTRTISFSAGQTVYSALNQLAEVGNGFDWDVGADKVFRLWASRGANNGVVLDYGGLISDVNRSFDPGTYANAIRVSAEESLTAQLVAATDIGDRPEGRWEAQVGRTQILNQPILDAAATRILGELQVLAPSLRCTLRAGDSTTDYWGGLSQIDLGDECRLVVRSGRLDVNEVVKVQEITITAGDDNDEKVDLVLDAPEETFIDTFLAQRQRINDLERR
jgi:hypothetical protein